MRHAKARRVTVTEKMGRWDLTCYTQHRPARTVTSGSECAWRRLFLAQSLLPGNAPGPLAAGGDVGSWRPTGGLSSLSSPASFSALASANQPAGHGAARAAVTDCAFLTSVVSWCCLSHPTAEETEAPKPAPPRNQESASGSLWCRGQPWRPSPSQGTVPGPRPRSPARPGAAPPPGPGDGQDACVSGHLALVISPKTRGHTHKHMDAHTNTHTRTCTWAHTRSVDGPPCPLPPPRWVSLLPPSQACCSQPPGPSLPGSSCSPKRAPWSPRPPSLICRLGGFRPESAGPAPPPPPSPGRPVPRPVPGRLGVPASADKLGPACLPAHASSAHPSAGLQVELREKGGKLPRIGVTRCLPPLLLQPLLLQLDGRNHPPGSFPGQERTGVGALAPR